MLCIKLREKWPLGSFPLASPAKYPMIDRSLSVFRERPINHSEPQAGETRGQWTQPTTVKALCSLKHMRALELDITNYYCGTTSHSASDVVNMIMLIQKKGIAKSKHFKR